MAKWNWYQVFSYDTINGTKETRSHCECNTEERAEQVAIAVGDMYGVGYYTNVETGEVLFYYEV